MSETGVTGLKKGVTGTETGVTGYRDWCNRVPETGVPETEVPESG